MPVNADTVKEGDYYFRRDRHMPHWATCPDAKEFRKKKEANADTNTSGSGSTPKAAWIPATSGSGKTATLAKIAKAKDDEAGAGVRPDPRSSEAGG